MRKNGISAKLSTSAFLGENFLLDNQNAVELYHNFAKDLPIIDYHCHLSPEAIAVNQQFDNLSQVWLDGDHYKWRAMRINGIAEKYITGNASDVEKFKQWAATVPYTLRNPLYHWSHLELKRYFGVDQLLSAQNAQAVYTHCNELLQTPDYRVHGLLHKMGVEVICTTDNPTDDLHFHRQIEQSPIDIKVLPTFRPDNAILIEKDGFKDYIEKLGEICNLEINSYPNLLQALEQRVDYFHQHGARLSDHGLNRIYAEDFTAAEIESVFRKRLDGQSLSETEVAKFQFAVLIELGKMYHARGWVQQFHLGAQRNNNSRLLRQLGPDTGFDSIGDYSQAASLARFLDRLDTNDQLARTILYNLNPSDNEVFATMVGNFNDGSMAGKVQWGSAWWFLDQLDGMEKQINTLSNMGLVSRFVGMLTDSRSFLSYPRHEYFRRLLCNVFGQDIAKGRLPADIDWIGKIISDISYHNAKQYFNF